MAISGISIGRPGLGAGNQVVVPAVVGLTEAAAKQALEDRGLKASSRKVEDSGTPGTVFSQDPAAQSARARGTTVKLLVITAPTTPPPDLGKKLDDIQTAVGEAKTATGEVKTAVDGVKTATDEVKTAVDGVKTATDEVKTATGDIKTAVAEVKTATGDIKTAVDGVGTAVAAVDAVVRTVETDDKAEARKREILDKLTEINEKLSGYEGKATSAGTTRTK